VEAEESLLKKLVGLYTLASVCGEEKGRNTYALIRLASPGRAGCGEVRRWVWAHDVRVNDPLKSGTEPRMSATSF
jgi:hypothetical protein